MNRVAAISSLLVLPSAAFAVYAPIPPLEQGQAITVTAEAALIYDDNIFGAPSGEVESWVLRVSPKVEYNHSLSDNSFLSASYRLDGMFYDSRPTDDTLFNHEFAGRVFYAFDENSELRVSNTLSFIDSPVSLRPLGGTFQTDQSLKQNVFNARLTGNLSETIGLTGKLRHLYLSYDQTALANLLDREEWMLGLEAFYRSTETTKFVGELRFVDVDYDVAQAVDSQSILLLGGVDYEVSQRTSLTTRVGIERRDRRLATSKDTNFFGELAAVHRYAQGSYFSTGIRVSTTDTDATSDYADQDGRMIFLNVQHMVSGNIYVSSSISYELADLNPRADRPGLAGIDDKFLRLGLAATYLITDNFSVTASLDIDRFRSDASFREQDRTRFGISARYAFGLGN